MKEEDSSTRKKAIGSKINGLVKSFDKVKQRTQARFYWGRSSYYKNFLHFFIIFSTVIIATFGIAARLFSTQTDATSIAGEQIVGTTDLLQQGGSIHTVLLDTSEVKGLATTKHKVEEGETLASIAEEFGVSVDTIRWASSDVVSPFTDRLDVGWELTIPELNGVLYTVRAGQTLDQIIAETSVANQESNRFNIVEFNNLKEPVELAAGQVLFIPDGNLRNTGATGSISEIPRGVFVDPLLHPACSGYNFSRGFLPYHNGVDLAKWNGCPISAVANGTVAYAGWGSQGQGYMVRIDHGGGIVTEYFHGNGTYWVKTGDFVRQGQEIMNMGSTGYSTGVHLHFILWKDGVAINPRPYVPYKGSY